MRRICQTQTSPVVSALRDRQFGVGTDQILAFLARSRCHQDVRVGGCQQLSDGRMHE